MNIHSCQWPDIENADSGRKRTKHKETHQLEGKPPLQDRACISDLSAFSGSKACCRDNRKAEASAGMICFRTGAGVAGKIRPCVQPDS